MGRFLHFLGTFRNMKFDVLEKSLFGLGILSGLAFAAPANPAPFTVENQGDELTLQRGGDEHYRFTRTSDGFLVVQGDDQVYYYADEQGEASEYKARNENARTAQEKAFLKKLNREAVLKSHREKHPDRFVRPREHQAPKRAPWVPTENVSGGSDVNDDVHPLLRLPSPEAHANGTNRFPIILVTTSGGREYLDSATFHQMLNKEGYNANGYVGSVRDYFVDQSSGRFVPTFDIYKVSVSNSLSSYKDSDYKLVVDAVNAIKNRYPSFDASPYDSDKDGKVDAVGVFFSGDDDSGVGGYHYELRWRDVTNLSVGGKIFNSYYLLSQGTYPYVGLIHEFSHSMGLMDHYCVYSNDCYSDFTNNQYQSPGAHAWDVMATGMYNNYGKNPPNYSAFERNFMGWLDYDALENVPVTTVAPLHKSNKAIKIPVSGNNDEWFILENRQQSKWDAGLPNHGLLIWHIDYNQKAWNSDALNDDPAHQHIDVVEAGNLKVTGFYDGQSATHLKDDSFPGSQNVTSYGPFKSWGGVDLGVSLYGIMEENNDACFTTQKGVNVTTCKVASSSSVSAESSSSVLLSSSSVNVSSSSIEFESSSSRTPVVSSSSVATSSSSLIPEESSSSAELEESCSSALAVSEAKVSANGVRMAVSAGVLELTLPVEGVKAVKVFDLQGNVVFEQMVNGSRASLNVGSVIPKGAYIVGVSRGNHVLGAQKICVP